MGKKPTPVGKKLTSIKKNLLPFIYIAPAWVLMLAITFYPIFYSFRLSLTDMNLFRFLKYNFVWFENYKEILGNFNGEFYIILARTVVWTVANLTVQVVVGLGLALLLVNPKLRLRSVYRTLLIVSWVVPAYITALMWKGMFNYDFGAINQILQMIGMGKVNWLNEVTFAWISIFIVNVWMAFPFMMTVCLGGLQSISHEYYEAADIDGASWWQKLRNITLPLIKPVLAPAVIMTSFVTFKQFEIVWLMTSGGPADRTMLVMPYLFKNAFRSYRYGYAAAYGVVIFLILLVMVFSTMRATKATKEVY